MNDAPKILVTGCNGQVGHYVLQSMKTLGDCVAAIGPGEAVPGATLIDLADVSALRAFVLDHKPDIIINPAAYTEVDKAEEESELATAINATAPGVLAEAAKTLDALLVHYSTDYVFRGDGNRPWVETDPTDPQNVYGQTKLDGERQVLGANPRSFVLRTSWVVSPIGHNFVKTMLKLGQEREALNIVNDQWGAPASASDLARLTRLVVQKSLEEGSDWTAQHAGIFHLTSTGETTWHGIAERVFWKARQLGVDLAVQSVGGIPTKDYPTPASRPLNSRLNCEKFIHTFGATPVAWETAVDQIVETLLQT